MPFTEEQTEEAVAVSNHIAEAAISITAARFAANRAGLPEASAALRGIPSRLAEVGTLLDLLLGDKAPSHDEHTERLLALAAENGVDTDLLG